MKTRLHKLFKPFALVLLLITAVSSCKKETTIKPDPDPPATKTSSAKGKIDGKNFTIKESGLKSTLYTTSGDGVKSLETSATLNADGNKLTFFIDDLKNGVINLTKKTGTSLNPGTRTIKLDANTVQSYVYYYSGGNTYFAYSGKIEMTVTDVDITVTWNISFKDGTGREFNSSGSFTITFATVVTKPKSEVKDPTPVADKPTVENISPTKGRAGDTVAITGVNYSTTPADDVVKFNGTNAEVISATATKLTVKVPAQGTSGALSVKVKNSEVAQGPAFTYIQPATFVSFSPASAKIGETVTITGTNFSTDKTDNIVKFKGPQGTLVTAIVTDATATQLKVTVPQSAVTGKIILNVLNGGNLTSATDFTLVTTTNNSGDWEDLNFNVAIQESTISVAAGNGFMFIGGSFPKYVYYTPDGVTYTNVYANIPVEPGANLELHLIKSDGVYYYLTTNLGIYRTQDGSTWKKLVISPNNPNMGITGLVAARGGNLTCIIGTLLYTSNNSGDTWNLTQVTKPVINTFDYLTPDGFNKYWYAVDMSANYLNAPSPHKLYKSADAGKTWTATGATTGIYFFGSGNQNFITASGYNIYCLYSPNSASIADQRLYKTSNQGDTWTKVTEGLVYYVKAFGDYVVYGAEDFNVSNDAGATFKNYPLPAGYSVGGVERSNGYFYVFAWNRQNQHRIFRKKI